MSARIGLTGGIGSGKSLVARHFRELGVTIIDADEIAHRLSEPGTVEFGRIVDLFGRKSLQADGTLDRRKIATIVFRSARKRKALEAILHPAIRAEMQSRAADDDGCYCLLDIPLLIESGQYRDMDRVLVVNCAEDIRMRRLQHDRNMNRGEIERIIANQASDAQRMKVADDIIDNNGDVADLESQVKRLHRVYTARFCC